MLSFSKIKPAAGFLADKPSSEQPVGGREPGKDIAIIGLGMKLPMADSLERFWELLKSGVDFVRPLPESRQRDALDMLRRTGRAGSDIRFGEAAYLDAIDTFDCEFFRISPKEARLMDPHQRLFLQTAWTALEDAGYGGGRLAGSRTGVYVGYGGEAEYKRFVAAIDKSSLPLAAAGNVKPIIASRLAYMLDLRGPSLLVDTTCSSSLMAIHLACQALRNRECDTAIAGGIQLHLLPVRDTEIGVAAPDGRAKTFDARSDGTGTGEGVAALLLKPLHLAQRDGDHIYAVIKGSAANSDGASIGITAPNAQAQEDVLVRAWEEAGITPDTLGYLEAHGTGTKLGDPIEIDGIRRAFRRYTPRKNFCAIGSVKSNIGHLDNASGIAGVVKMIAALRYRALPPTLHFRRPNGSIAFIDSPVYLNDALQPWETDGAPRRCGVSSFGISGTNCHLVLEEASLEHADTAQRAESAQRAEVVPLHRVSGSVYHVLALSARTEQALRELSGRFADRLGTLDDDALASVCRTANTGRGHHAVRAAWAVASAARLCEALRAFAAGQTPDEEAAADMTAAWSGAAGQQLSAAGEAALSLAEALAAWTPGAAAEHAAAAAVARHYAAGADVPWGALYGPGSGTRLPLPAYPFAETRCWPDAESAAAGQSVQATGAIGPLVDRRLAESMGVDIYATEFAVDRHWVLSEHKIMGESVLVGTSFLEMAAEAWRSAQPEALPAFRDVVFYQPMIVRPGERREAHLIFDKTGNRFRFTVVSRPVSEVARASGPAAWTKHMEGGIEASEAGAGARRTDIGALTQAYMAGYIKPDLDAYNEESPFEFGPRWKNLQAMYVGPQELLSEIELPDTYRAELTTFLLHPSLLDNALATTPLVNRTLASVPDRDDFIYIPYSYGRIELLGALPERFWSVVTSRDPLTGGAPELLEFDIDIVAPNGDVLVRIYNYTLKKLARSKFRQMSASPSSESAPHFFKLGWLPASLRVIDASRHRKALTLVLTESGTQAAGARIVEEQRLAGQEAVLVEADSEPSGGMDRPVSLGFGESNAKAFLERWMGEERELRLVVLAEGSNEPTRAAVPKDALQHAIGTADSSRFMGERAAVKESGSEEGIPYYSTADGALHRWFALFKALLAAEGPLPSVYVVLEYAFEATGEEPTISPLHAALSGLARTVRAELPALNVCVIDRDPQTAEAVWLKELEAEDQEELVVYRDGARYVPQLERLELNDAGGLGATNTDSFDPTIEAAKAAPYLWKRDGVYLITGGLGGIGLEVAVQLAKWGAGQIALLHRSPFPDRASWDALDLAGEDGRRAIKLREAEAAGALVIPVQTDVTDEAALAEALVSLRAAYGPIRGIIHSAGIAGDGFLQRKSWKQFRGVTAPKMEGTRLLDRLTSDDPLEMMILFSSNTTLLGVPGQSDYMAGNCYLDAYAAYRSKKGRRTLTVNWPAWQETGMAVRYGVNKDQLLKALSTADALEALGRLLASPAKQAYVGRFHMSGKLHGIGFADIGLRFSPEVRELLSGGAGAATNAQSAGKGSAVRAEAASLGPGGSRAALTGKAAAELYTDAERVVADVWLDVLGFEEIDVHADFFAIGGDSIAANAFAGRLASRAGTDVPMNILFKHPTVSGLAIWLDAQGSQGAALDTASPASVIPAAPNLSFYPLSEPQRSMFVLQQMQPQQTAYNLPRLIAIEGLPDADRMEQALQRLIARHETLRTSFHFEDGEPAQRIHGEALFALARYDAEGRGPEALVRDFVKAFDLAVAPLMRAALVREADERHYLLFDVHHIISDGVSMGRMIEEFILLYEGRETALNALPIQYKDYAYWQSERKASPALLAQEQYWAEALGGPLPDRELPADRKRSDARSSDGDQVIVQLPADLTERLRQTGLRHGATLFMLLLTAYHVLLAKYTGADDVITGSPHAGRQHQGTEPLIGMFVNPLPLRARPSAHKAFSALLQETKQTVVQAFEHPELPLERIVELLRLERKPNRNPIYDTVFVMQNMESPELRTEDLRFRFVEIDRKEITMDITLEAAEKDGGIRLRLEYATALFDRVTAERLLTDYTLLLEAAAASPDVAVGQMALSEAPAALAGPLDIEAEFDF